MLCCTCFGFLIGLHHYTVAFNTHRPLIPFVNKSHTTPNHIRDLNPHLISTIITPPSRACAYVPVILMLSALLYFNAAAPISYKAAQSNPQQLPLPLSSPFSLFFFKCSHWKQLSGEALMEKSHSKR